MGSLSTIKRETIAAGAPDQWALAAHNAELLQTVRCVRDCGVVRARGLAKTRFERAEKSGYLLSTFNRDKSVDYKLSTRGRQIVAAWLIGHR